MCAQFIHSAGCRVWLLKPSCKQPESKLDRVLLATLQTKISRLHSQPSHSPSATFWTWSFIVTVVSKILKSFSMFFHSSFQPSEEIARCPPSSSWVLLAPCSSSSVEVPNLGPAGPRFLTASAFIISVFVPPTSSSCSHSFWKAWQFCILAVEYCCFSNFSLLPTIPWQAPALQVGSKLLQVFLRKEHVFAATVWTGVWRWDVGQRETSVSRFVAI